MRGNIGELFEIAIGTVQLVRRRLQRLLGLLASGESREAILEAYPYLEAADIDEVLTYAAAIGSTSAPSSCGPNVQL